MHKEGVRGGRRRRGKKGSRRRMGSGRRKEQVGIGGIGDKGRDEKEGGDGQWFKRMR